MGVRMGRDFNWIGTVSNKSDSENTRFFGIAGFKSLLDECSGLHDAEIVSLQVDPDRRQINLFLRDLGNFRSVDRYCLIYSEVHINFSGVDEIRSTGEPNLEGYGIDAFWLENENTAYLETIVGWMSFSFEEVNLEAKRYPQPNS